MGIGRTYGLSFMIVAVLMSCGCLWYGLWDRWGFLFVKDYTDTVAHFWASVLAVSIDCIWFAFAVYSSMVLVKTRNYNTASWAIVVASMMAVVLCRWIPQIVAARAAVCRTLRSLR